MKLMPDNKCLALRITGALREWLNRLVLRQWRNHCYDAALRIVTIGQDWDADTQQHLNEAKNHLYKAAQRFDDGHAYRRPKP